MQSAFPPLRYLAGNLNPFAPIDFPERESRHFTLWSNPCEQHQRHRRLMYWVNFHQQALGLLRAQYSNFPRLRLNVQGFDLPFPFRGQPLVCTPFQKDLKNVSDRLPGRLGPQFSFVRARPAFLLLYLSSNFPNIQLTRWTGKPLRQIVKALLQLLSLGFRISALVIMNVSFNRNLDQGIFAESLNPLHSVQPIDDVEPTGLGKGVKEFSSSFATMMNRQQPHSLPVLLGRCDLRFHLVAVLVAVKRVNGGKN